MAITQDCSPFTPYFLPQGHLLEVGRVASREATPLYGEIELKVLILVDLCAHTEYAERGH